MEVSTRELSSQSSENTGQLIDDHDDDLLQSQQTPQLIINSRNADNISRELANFDQTGNFKNNVASLNYDLHTISRGKQNNLHDDTRTTRLSPAERSLEMDVNEALESLIGRVVSDLNKLAAQHKALNGSRPPGELSSPIDAHEPAVSSTESKVAAPASAGSSVEPAKGDAPPAQQELADEPPSEARTTIAGAAAKHEPGAAKKDSDQAKLEAADSDISQLEAIVSQSSKVEEGDLDDSREEKEKDIVTLRNLEITPPPQAQQETVAKGAQESAENSCKALVEKQSRDKKRSFTPDSSGTLNDSTDSGGRSKRQRTQTKLFQIVDTKLSNEDVTNNITTSTRKRSTRLSSTGNSKSSTAPTKSTTNSTPAQDTDIRPATVPLDVIFYEKNDFLAIRNEENSFYLCQLAENVKVNRPLIKVKWLDTRDDGKSYFLTSQYDNVPQKSILMPVILVKLKSTKKGEHLFSLDDQDRDNIMDRLKKSLSLPSEASSSQDAIS